MSLRYAYFPGCSATGSCQELDQSTKAVARLFGVDLVELVDAGCTGAREFRGISERLHLVANGNILARAEAVGADLVVVCDTCLLNLTEVNNRLKADAAARADVNRELAPTGVEYRGVIDVTHFLWVLLEDVGVERLRRSVVRPLGGLRIAPFYGCHLLRPASAYDQARGRDRALERLCEIVGAVPVAYAGSQKCCGFHVALTETPTAVGMTGAHLADAQAQGAECMVTPCPLCHTMLDAFQPAAAQAVGASVELPTLHVSQLIGLAAGLSPKALGLSRHVISPRRVVAAAR
jgi:succinate dehydrogenase / fumarate reductase, cytochrome b subunit